KELAPLADPAHHMARYRATSRDRVDRKAPAARSDRSIGTLGVGSEPLGGPGDPGAPFAVRLPDVPALQERAFDGGTLGALEVIVARHRAHDAVEGPAEGPIAGHERDHGPFFVHGLTEPLGDATLARARGPDQKHETLDRLGAL